jgi:hypothetical protein
MTGTPVDPNMISIVQTLVEAFVAFLLGARQLHAILEKADY